MFAPYLISILGLVLFVLLILVYRRRSISDADQLHAALGNATPYRDPDAGLLERIFDSADLVFMAGENSPSLLRLIAVERRDLVLAWLNEIRREASSILKLHRRSVRHLSDLRPGAEVRLALHALAFNAGCLLASALVRCYGAFETRAVIRQLLQLCDRLTRLLSEMRSEIGAERQPAIASSI